MMVKQLAMTYITSDRFFMAQVSMDYYKDQVFLREFYLAVVKLQDKNLKFLELREKISQ